MEKQIIQNAIITPDGTILNSRHRHDYVKHADTITGEVFFVDGGDAYIRRNFGVPKEDLTLYSDDDFEIIREKLLRGNYGKDGKQPLKYVRLKDIDYLDALIDYEELHRPKNPYLEIYKKEREWRQTTVK